MEGRVFCCSSGFYRCIVHWLCQKYVFWREAGDVWCLPLVWDIRTVIWFQCTISALVLLPTPTALCLVFLFCLQAHSCYFFFPQKILQFFSSRERLFCIALVLQLGDDSWWVDCTACRHLTLVFAIIHFYISTYFVCFCSFLFYINIKKMWVCVMISGRPANCLSVAKTLTLWFSWTL